MLSFDAAVDARLPSTSSVLKALGAALRNSSLDCNIPRIGRVPRICDNLLPISIKLSISIDLVGTYMHRRIIRAHDFEVAFQMVLADCSHSSQLTSHMSLATPSSHKASSSPGLAPALVR